MRIGFAKDIHRLVENRKLVLGGIEIPYHKGLLAHSDGDVVIHSLVDAIIGAMNEGDIGQIFPDNDDKYKNISSIYFLKEIKTMLLAKGLEVEYIDIFISCEAPKLKNYIEKMKENISSTLNIDISRVSIKAGTNEGIGEIGQNLAIESYATCLLKEKNYGKEN